MRAVSFTAGERANGGRQVSHNLPLFMTNIVHPTSFAYRVSMLVGLAGLVPKLVMSDGAIT